MDNMNALQQGLAQELNVHPWLDNSRLVVAHCDTSAGEEPENFKAILNMADTLNDVVESVVYREMLVRCMLLLKQSVIDYIDSDIVNHPDNPI
jgi:hypothetical protein